MAVPETPLLDGSWNEFNFSVELFVLVPTLSYFSTSLMLTGCFAKAVKFPLSLGLAKFF